MKETILIRLRRQLSALPRLRRAVLLVPALFAMLIASAEDFTFTYEEVTLKYSTIDDKTCMLVGYVGSPSQVVIPSRVNTSTKFYSVTSIGTNAFSGCSSLTSVIIPESVTSIGTFAFNGCSKLTSVTIPESITSIEGNAFKNCSSLDSVTIPESVTSIGSYAFSNCTSLTSVTIPNSVTSIGASAFSGCSSLTSVTIPESVTSIERYAFSNCSGLTSVTIPSSLTSIGYHVFEGCSSLTSITIPNSVTSIDEAAFHACSSLTSVTIPNSVISIGIGAFHDCSSLSSVTIPESVTSIGRNAFTNCSSLTSVTIPESITVINNGTFSGCSSLTSITIPESVTVIESGAFSGCSSITTITIPESVISIGKEAFSGCSGLISVKIPGTVTSIGESAFSGCDALNYVAYDTDSPITGTVNVFSEGIYKTATLFLPNDAIESAKSIVPWGLFNKIEILKAVPENIEFTESKKNVLLGTPQTLTISFEPALVKDMSLKWTSSDETVATVDESGEVTGLSVGSATITATSINGLSATCEVAVFEEPIGITLDKTEIELEIGQIIRITAMAIPENAFQAVVWSSSDETVASVDESGAVKGERNGTAIITATTINDLEASCEVTVLDFPTEITLDQTEAEVFVDETFQLTAIVLPEKSSRAVQWSSSDFSIVSVDESGKVTGKTFGTAIITATTLNGLEATCKVTVWEKPTGITIEMTKADLPVASSLLLTPKVLPENANTRVIWSSSDESVASVDESGMVWGISAGTVTISGSTVNGLSATCEITVTPLNKDDEFSVSYQAHHLKYKVIDENTCQLVGYEGSPEELIIPSRVYCFTVVSIYPQAFLRCSSLTSVTIPNSVSSVGQWAFSYCPSLKNFTITDGDTEISFGAHILFNTPIRNIYIGRNWSWPSYTTYYGTGISSNNLTITLGAQVTKLPDDAFFRCQGLISLSIPESVKSIGWRAFRECLSLTSVTIPSSVTSISEYAFSGCSNLTSIVIPNSLTAINNSLFEDCTSLTSVTIPESITIIGGNVFKNCSSLTSVAIPESVTFIGGGAFEGCSKLTTIRCDAQIPPFARDNAFEKYDGVRLIVPEGSIEKYKSTDPWSKFYFESEPSGIEGVEGDGAKVSVEGGDIVVSGGERAEVYSLTGVRVAVITDGRVSGLPRGVYLVRLNGKTVKVVL